MVRGSTKEEEQVSDSTDVRISDIIPVLPWSARTMAVGIEVGVEVGVEVGYRSLE